MSPNEIVALDARLKIARNERAPEMAEDEFFRVFATEQILKDFDLTDEEIQSGQVDGEHDAGLDGVYFLLNGAQLVTDETDINPKTTSKAELVFIQASLHAGFEEAKVNNLNLLTEDFLNLSKGDKDLQYPYSEDVLAVLRLFKEKYPLLYVSSHEFKVSYYYVTRGDTKNIGIALRRLSERTQEKAKLFFPTAIISFKFIGALELAELTSKQPQKNYPLPYSEIMEPAKQKAWVCLVPITEYFKFITTENGDLNTSLFEGNVRDWNGDNDVNEAIRTTLENGAEEEDFWWLNNGVTILASNAVSQGGKVLSIQVPQVVNGLQTSRCIYNYFSGRKELAHEQRNVLVRVIAAQKADSPDHIIKATNSQTPVRPFLLHMTEPIHRNIEVLLRPHNLFYDRRKNYYKNDGQPIARIVQPLSLAQTVISIILQRPNDARARPASVLDKSYKEVFSPEYPLQLFAVCVLFMRKVNAFLLSPGLGLTKTDRTNLRWYLAMQYARALTKADVPKPSQLVATPLPNDDQLVKLSYDRVREAYSRLGGTDLTAKGPELLVEIKKLPYVEIE